MAGRFMELGVPSAFAVANAYLCAGDKEQTFEWLERAYRDGDRNMPYLGLPVFDSIRSDPRFQDLLRRMNLPSGLEGY
jgi:hypothetical protein